MPLTNPHFEHRPLSDADLDAILPSEGYTILPPPASYIPLRGVRLNATPTPLTTPGYQMPGEQPQSSYDIPQSPSDPTLPDIKPEDMQYFGSLLKSDSEEVQSIFCSLSLMYPHAGPLTILLCRV
jgi:splicing factor 3B subunit 1